MLKHAADFAAIQTFSLLTAFALFVGFVAWGYARSLWWRFTHRGR